MRRRATQSLLSRRRQNKPVRSGGGDSERRLMGHGVMKAGDEHGCRNYLSELKRYGGSTQKAPAVLLPGITTVVTPTCARTHDPSPRPFKWVSMQHHSTNKSKCYVVIVQHSYVPESPYQGRHHEILTRGMQVRQSHLPPNSYFSSDFVHFMLKLLENLKNGTFPEKKNSIKIAISG